MSMFTSWLCCCCEDSEDERSETPSDQLRLLLDSDSSSDMPARVKRTYGKKTTVASTIAALAAPREPLADITDAVAQLQVVESVDNTSTVYPSSSETEQDPISDGVDEEALRSIIEDAVTSSSEISDRSSGFSVSNSLRPLFDAYAKDRSPATLQTESWEEVMPKSCTITKIAEASFAEVYRVNTDDGDSIVKIMRIRSSDVDADQCYLGQRAEEMVSEFRIMNALTELPGFVSFKDARVIRGKATQAIVDACKEYLDANGADDCVHPAPSTYTNDSLFLAMELGDAGMVLEDIVFSDIMQVWDVLIGAVMALSRAECEFEFEHRDLHENNICYTFKQPSSASTAIPPQQKFERSGIVITLIDYGLSRAKLSEDNIIFYDMEADLEIFKGISRKSKPTIQFETYRRMRTWLLSGTRTHEARNKMVPQPVSSEGINLKSWEEFMPYSNVLWIRYLLDWLKQKMNIDGLDSRQIDQFTADMIDFERKLDPRTKLANAFMSAAEVLEFMVAKGWVSEEQVQEHGFDSSVLSETRTVTSQRRDTSS